MNYRIYCNFHKTEKFLADRREAYYNGRAYATVMCPSVVCKLT